MAFLFIRKSNQDFWIVSCPKNVSYKWIVAEIVELTHWRMEDRMISVNDRRLLTGKAVARMIVDLALKDDKKFWGVDPGNLLYYNRDDEFRELCLHGVVNDTESIDYTFDNAVNYAVEKHHWRQTHGPSYF